MQPRDFGAPRPRITPELMRFYKKRAQQLRTEAIVSRGLHCVLGSPISSAFAGEEREPHT